MTGSDLAIRLFAVTFLMWQFLRYCSKILSPYTYMFMVCSILNRTDPKLSNYLNCFLVISFVRIF